MSTFQSLNITSSSVIQQLKKIGFTTPTPIQTGTIPVISEGKDTLAFSPTGSGKTGAFILPLVDRLISSVNTQEPFPYALILVPTRELALQVADFYNNFTNEIVSECATIYGGVAYEQQIEALAKEPRVIIATPGRLIDLMEQKKVDISKIRYLVLDEVDQMVDMGFRDAIYYIASQRNPSSCQTICFSATFDENTQTLLTPLMQQPEIVNLLSTSYNLDNISQEVYIVERTMMNQLMYHLIRRENPQQAIIFTRSRKMADIFARELSEAGFPAEAFHSDRSQAAREYILQRFRNIETNIIVATDVMARGIDIDTVTHVFNYGLPQMPELYTHRIGRTGRNGREGKALSVCELQELDLLTNIEKHMKKSISRQLNHPFATMAVTKALMEANSPKAKKKKKR